MANEAETVLREVAGDLIRYIKNASELVVETRYSQVVSNSDAQAAPAPAASGDSEESESLQRARAESRAGAVTVIQLDGDSVAVVPLRLSSTGDMLLDRDLLEEHQRNVAAATQYRAQILQSLVGLLQSRGRGL
ncbi:MAG: hypothetical protein RLZZ387_5422 [Chloroflexota bacterium]